MSKNLIGCWRNSTNQKMVERATMESRDYQRERDKNDPAQFGAKYHYLRASSWGVSLKTLPVWLCIVWTFWIGLTTDLGCLLHLLLFRTFLTRLTTSPPWCPPEGCGLHWCSQTQHPYHKSSISLGCGQLKNKTSNTSWNLPNPYLQHFAIYEECQRQWAKVSELPYSNLLYTSGLT